MPRRALNGIAARGASSNEREQGRARTCVERPASISNRPRNLASPPPDRAGHRRALLSAEAYYPPVAERLAGYDFTPAAVRAEGGGVAVAMGDGPQPETRGAADERRFLGLGPVFFASATATPPRIPLALALWVRAMPDAHLKSQKPPTKRGASRRALGSLRSRPRESPSCSVRPRRSVAASENSSAENVPAGGCESDDDGDREEAQRLRTRSSSGHPRAPAARPGQPGAEPADASGCRSFLGDSSGLECHEHSNRD